MVWIALAGIVLIAVLGTIIRAGQDDDDDGPGGPRRARVRVAADSGKRRAR